MKNEPESEEAQIFAEIRRRSGFTSNSSTGSDESFGAYVARKLDEMEQSGQPEVTPKTNCKVKQSESEPIVVRPNCGPIGQASSTPTQPLSLSKYISAANNPDVKHIEPGEVIDTYEFTFAPAVKHKSIRNENESRQLDSTSLEQHERHLAETQSGSETEVPFLSDHDSTRYARSTLAEALAPPALEKTVDSPGAQTLAELKREAAMTKTKKKKGSKRPIATKSKKKKPVWRSNKVMREELFEGISWARTFVTGPMDPKWNPYKFYCQICKGNVSIYGRGVKEILRHHGTERHLRRDQRWRYEHLSVEDPVTKTIRHYVRDENGKLLTPYELELEYPKFKDVTLVDIGEKLPFYDEAMAGNTHMTSSSESRVRVQISILGHFLPNFGDIRSLRSLWKDIGIVVNHQALFSDFNWGKERLSVSLHKVICDSAPN